MLFSFRTLLFITSLFVSAGTWSSCIKVTDKSALSAAAIKAGYTAQNWIGATDTNTGNIGLPTVISISNSETFQPSGTLLASGIGNFLTAATGTPYSSKQVLTAAILPMPGSSMRCIRQMAIALLRGHFLLPK